MTKRDVPRKANNLRPLRFDSLEARLMLDASAAATPMHPDDNDAAALIAADPDAMTDDAISLDAVADSDSATCEQTARSLKILFIGNSLAEDARAYLADAAAQYADIDPDQVKIGCLYQGGRPVGYFANCARVEQGADPSEYDYDFYTYTNDADKTQVDAPDNGYGDATKNFCDYYEWSGVEWVQLKGAENLGEKTIEYAMAREDWDVVLIQGYNVDFIDYDENGNLYAQPSADPDKAGETVLLRDSAQANLEYLCDYLLSLAPDVSLGYYLPTEHYQIHTAEDETRVPIESDDMLRVGQYLLENVDALNFVVPACVVVENMKTTYLNDISYADPYKKDVVVQGLRRDTIHASNFLTREAEAIGIVAFVRDYLYPDADDDAFTATVKFDSPSFGELPAEYMSIVHAAVDAALQTPDQTTQLDFSDTDPALVAYAAAAQDALEGGTLQEALDAARRALDDSQWVDVRVNYEQRGEYAAVSFSYGYTTSDVLLVYAPYLADDEEDDANAASAPVLPDEERAVYVVNSLADFVNTRDDVVTLREAVGLAKDGDLILFDDSLRGGTITLSGAAILIRSSVTIDAGNLYDEETCSPGVSVDAAGESRVFELAESVDSRLTVSITGLALVNGSSTEDGGAFYLGVGASVTLEKDLLAYNTAAGFGGAVSVKTGTLTIIDSVFSGNTALGGGAIEASVDATITASGTLFVGNDAAYDGGAIRANAASALFQNSTFAENAAGVVGGALHVTGGALTIQYSELYGNTAAFGGALASGGKLTLAYSTVHDNSASQYGGAVYATGSATSRLLQYTSVYRNTAKAGAGVYISGAGSSMTFRNGLVYENVSEKEGSAIATFFPGVNLYSTTIARNVSLGGFGATFVTGATMNFTNTIVAENVGGDVVKSRSYKYSNYLGANSVLSTFTEWSGASPNYYLYDPDQPLFYDADAGLFALAENSQAIDRGDSSKWKSALDYSGAKRVVGAAPDLGAYEYGAAISPAEITASYDSDLGVVRLEWAAGVSVREYKLTCTIVGADGSATVKTVALDGAVLSCDVDVPADSECYFAMTASNTLGIAKNTAQTSILLTTVSLDLHECSIGDTLRASLSREDADVLFQWSVLVNGVWTPLNATGDSLLVDESLVGRAIRVDAIGRGVCYGASSYDVAEYLPEFGYEYAPESREALLSWESIPDADGYLVRISRDNGATWINYARTTEQSCTVRGLYGGKTYLFRVYANDDAGKINDSTRLFERTIVPIQASCSASDFCAGDLVELACRVVDDALADVRWYWITDDGDVEIVEARGALSYRPASEEYSLRVVVEGLADAEGQRQEFVVCRPGAQVVNYDPDLRSGTLRWLEVDGAASYNVKISRDNGATWITYARTDALSCPVNGLYAGKTYLFRVYAVNEAGKIITSAPTRERAFVPFAAQYPAGSYFPGDTIDLTFKTAEPLLADVRWYRVGDDGSLVELTEARGLLEYTPEDAIGDIRVVVSGLGAAGESQTLDITLETFRILCDSDAHVATLLWLPLDGAASYNVKISRDDGSSWITYVKTSENSADVRGIYPKKTYLFRVYAVDNAGKVQSANYVEGRLDTSAPDAAALLDSAFASLFEE